MDTRIPVLIIVRDQLTWTKNLVEWIEKLDDVREIVIIDNKSSNPDLLDWYADIDHHVELLDINYGHKVAWTAGMVDRFADGEFVLTDPDLYPVTPDDALDVIPRLREYMYKYDRVKAGTALKIDDIDNKEAQQWEQQFWQIELETDIYDAWVDTTFALYSQGAPYGIKNSLRLAGNYVMRHMPWYDDKPEDYYYYVSNIPSGKGYTHWSENVQRV